MKLKGKTALVTGAAGGIGAEVCRLFSKEGANIVVADIDADAAEQLAAQVADSAIAVALDVSSQSSWTAVAQRFEDDEVALDILVNAAGISGFGNIDEIDYAFWTRFQNINADSIFLSVKSMLPMLRKSQAASVLNMGSTLALKPNGQLPAYSAAKGSLRSATKSLALYFAENGDNIRCNAIHPGSTLTPMMEANLGNSSEERQANYQARIDIHPLGKVLGRITLPDDIAKAALFLCSDDATFITGVDLAVDGGATAFC
ncbi:Enoyl-(Acyl carrier protein) reductase [Parasphingorhabdus marina DSM 22363]|uniref:Enoyl-(Acyl carrier protein) reductase n=2 Tax=Parasphingorhabdus marina TaxID=394732 RepID=A0A1N6D4K0_9SPHN|nr:Enoyl-(Acyl carrier protein) reductase [Parasphingorhabdus marina DSM 22363]